MAKSTGSRVCLGLPFVFPGKRKRRGQEIEGLPQLSGKKKEPHKVWLFYQTKQTSGSGTTRRAGCHVDCRSAARMAA